MDLKFSAHTYFMMRNSNLNSVSTENQHEILNNFGKCLLGGIFSKRKINFKKCEKLLKLKVWAFQRGISPPQSLFRTLLLSENVDLPPLKFVPEKNSF